MVRADSGYYRRDLIATAAAAKAWFSVTVRMNSRVRRAIAAIAENAWTTIRCPNAVWEPEDQRWISEAEVAEISFTASPPTPKTADALPARGAPGRTPQQGHRRRRRPGPAVHHLLVTASPRVRHRFVTTSTPSRVKADETHRDAIIEQVIAELIAGPSPTPHQEIHRQRCLADPGLPVLQHPARRRRSRIGPARQSPVGHPYGPTRSPSRPGSRPPAAGSSSICPPTGPGRQPGKTFGHRHHRLTDHPGPQGSRGNTHRGRIGQTAESAMPTYRKTTHKSEESRERAPEFTVGGFSMTLSSRLGRGFGRGEDSVVA